MDQAIIKGSAIMTAVEFDLGMRAPPVKLSRGRHILRGSGFARLTAFATVAHHRSFSRAAGYLGLSTPSLSQSIRSLEDELDIRLFNRTTRSVALTEAGEYLLDQLNPILESVDEAIDAIIAFNNAPAGLLRLTVHPLAAQTLIAPVAKHFSASYPAITLEISVDLEPRDIIVDRFDAGIAFGDKVAQDMIAIPLGKNVQFSTVASPEYLKHNSAPVQPDDLKRHNCIRYQWGRESSVARWKFKSSNNCQEVAVDGSLSVNDLEFALRAAIDGIGVVQLPENAVQRFVDAGRLVPILPGWAPQLGSFSLFYSDRRHVPTKLRTFVDFLKKEVKYVSHGDPKIRAASATDIPSIAIS
jgi:DNA-binding transcriptional LysR family regulator